jgi:hypothetical protein
MTKLRRRLSYANITATLALLFAMSGGALAATHYVITSTKQISPKVRKELKGAQGAKGPAGPAGPAGAAGAAGSQGPAGTAQAWASVQVSGTSGNATFTENSGFSGEPTSPSAGIICVPAPAHTAVALTLEAPGFIQQVAPNQCGGASNYEVATENTSGSPEDLPFTILVP